MNLKAVSILAIAVLCFITASCKKDDGAIVNGKKLGIGKGILRGPWPWDADFDEDLLTGKWQVTTVYYEMYNFGRLEVSDQISKYYEGVEISHESKTYKFNGGEAGSGKYSFINEYGIRGFITFQVDPFPRSENDEIEIIEVTPTSMTWIAYRKPSYLPYSGAMRQSAYKVVHTRLP